MAIVTKIDASSRPGVAEQLQAVSELRDWDSIIPISSFDTVQLDILTTELVKGLRSRHDASYKKVKSVIELRSCLPAHLI